ncbi:NAD-dependent epimerase/dehydratase family protein [Candidatus Cloacimonas acidaminovorans]|jgi:UDP-glucose 4-epimerase|uniref:UDP-glucose 4-epimerase (Galactowaldenase) (UDP-galactose 4-epimerase) n=1 Tax=Cloacimonas acidaminovorans (strain Evry) TaxID=459349 RepID=B0VET2_CLOAI|nr:NAD-dependent epimerase/dehydratase family protein [Candidatus Cloacimonas acidaminovorans]CAO81320.1 UDP-glucose 4-epimerase (Galactowaldenase) (UDP-galactose 4-epimerase) [Candidatus Cloacimonas acidaminovorans str. Evry]HNV62300.1 NAD-dependent epimerase/dehydratase family protein [Candidatus Cloacimonas acidaminovorans]
MKILVTGGAGFIGSNVADAYLQAGHEVVIVDNLVTGNRRNINPKAIFYEMDICDESLSEVFAKEKPDMVNHHSAQISVPLSIENPLLDVINNVYGWVNVLQNCVRTGVKKVIYISSGGAIYGEAEEYPTSEKYNPKPLSIYAINKSVGEDYLYFYRHQYGLNYTVLRYANVYGPRQISQGEAGVVSLFTEKLLKGEIPTVYRYDNEPDGMIRDYVYVGDVVQANLLALERGEGEVFNIGTSIPTTTKDLYYAIAKQLGINREPYYGPARKGDLHRSLLSCEKAKKVLGWKPETGLSEGISQVIKYFKELQ